MNIVNPQYHPTSSTRSTLKIFKTLKTLDFCIKQQKQKISCLINIKQDRYKHPASVA